MSITSQSAEIIEKFQDRGYVEQFLRENWTSFIDPLHWRLHEEDAIHVDVDLLRFRPPEFEVMFTVLTRNRETLHFYEALVLKPPTENERVKCEFASEGQKFHLIDGFTSKEFVAKLLKRWCKGERQDFLDFIGTFCGIVGEVNVEIKSLEPFFPPREEPTANYIYRCRGIVSSEILKKEFDVVIKKFVPRDPPDRGNKEYGIVKVLPGGMAPKFHGGLINHAYMIRDEAQVLVLFSDFIEGKNVGQIFWDLMLEINSKKKAGEDYKAQLGRLHGIVKDIVDKVIFPFHRSFRDLWYPFSYAVNASAINRDEYFGEMFRDLDILGQGGLLPEEERRKLKFLFSGAWVEILEKTRVAEIHHDLMWAQIVQSQDGKLIILDLDEHAPGHAAKDLGDLCAATRFMAESMPCEDRNLMRRIAEEINQTMIMRYRKIVQSMEAEWGEGIERALEIYLMLRHLHDAAYHFPIWSGATDSTVKERHKKYVDLSLNLLRKSVELLEKRIPKVYRLPEPGSYLVEEPVPARAFGMFNEMVVLGVPGFCISTSHPDDLKKKHEAISHADVLWLSKTKVEYAVHPTNLGTLRDRISDFLSRNENAVVLLDGFEYLVTMNGFDLALKFLHDLREAVVLKRARLIVPIAPGTLEPPQLKLLERYMQVVSALSE